MGNRIYYKLDEVGPELRDQVGEKAVMIGEMLRLELDTPPGLVLPKRVCLDTLGRGGKLDDSVCDAITRAVAELEAATGAVFGDGDNPMLLAVRVSASSYMPGVMGSMLNVGLTARSVSLMGKAAADPLPVLDSYRIYLERMAQNVYGADIHDILDRTSSKFGKLLLNPEKSIKPADLDAVNREIKRRIDRQLKQRYPENDPLEQLCAVIEAAYRSWGADMAKRTSPDGEPFEEAIAIILQVMVPWNFSPDSGAGMVYTRNPRTGERELFGFFYPHSASWTFNGLAAGKCDIQELAAESAPWRPDMERDCARLEEHLRSVQKIEFAIHEGRFYPLQTREAALEPEAAIAAAVAMAEEGLISRRDAMMRVNLDDMDRVLHQRWNPSRQGAIGFDAQAWSPATLVEEVRANVVSGPLKTLLDWADAEHGLKVRTNADLPQEALLAREFGAVGIGLCRTERMFLDPERLPVFQDMILSENIEARRELLDTLSRMQMQDFEEIFRIMQGLPVAIRLLDPPLHEFLPRFATLAKQAERATDPELPRIHSLMNKVLNLQEANPMLGFRGCRMGILHPEIYEMQVRAIFETALMLHEEGIKVYPEILIPLVGHYMELRYVRGFLEDVIRDVVGAEKPPFPYAFGTMIEIPRAALTADEIAGEVDFFSFGTNDLSQTTFGFSREDAEAKFLYYYMDHRILPNNPFEMLDIRGVGRLMELANEAGRRVKPELVVGMCGRQSSDPEAIRFCHDIGLDYISCSPLEVARVRLASAQTVLARGTLPAP